MQWITQGELSKQRKHYTAKKCSYFCVGCLSPNSFMLSWKRKLGRKERHLSGGGWHGDVRGGGVESGPAARTINAHFPAGGKWHQLIFAPVHSEEHTPACWFFCLTVCGNVSGPIWSWSGLAIMKYYPNNVHLLHRKVILRELRCLAVVFFFFFQRQKQQLQIRRKVMTLRGFFQWNFVVL